MKTPYEQRPHGTDQFPVAIFSEDTYGAEPHHHKEYEILFLTKGTLKLSVEPYEHSISAGDILFLEPYTGHSFLSEGNAFHYYALLFDPSILGAKDDPTRMLMERVRFHRYISLSDDILSRIPALYQADREQIFGREILMKLFIFSILNHLIVTRQYTEISGKKQWKDNFCEAVRTAVEYIELNYREEIRTEDILRLVTYSQSHFMRLFKQETGYSITGYLNHVRVDKACLDLLYSQKTLTEIASCNGFSNQQYFSKVFTSIMKQTPGKFRSGAKEMIAPPLVTPNI